MKNTRVRFDIADGFCLKSVRPVQGTGVDMARFNVTDKRSQAPGGSAFPAKGTKSQEATAVNPEGRTAWKLDKKTELFIGATTAFASQDTFYEKSAKRDERLIRLVRELAVEDWAWTADFLAWLRSEGNMRTAPIMFAVEAVRARLAAGEWGAAGARVPAPLTDQVAMTNRRLIAAVLQRADEPGEMLAYLENVVNGDINTRDTPRSYPRPIMRGIADAVLRLYNERNFLRYNSENRALGFGSVIELAQMPKTSGWQADLFRYAIDMQHGHADEIPESLRMLHARDAANKMTPQERHDVVRRELKTAEYTQLTLAMAGQWEWVHSWLGDTKGVQNPLTKKEQWELVGPQLGIFAAVRNLRNLDEAGFKSSDKLVKDICDRLADGQQIAKSRMFPFRFFTAHLQLKSVTWAAALEQAAQHSLSNIPELPGRTLVLVDTSLSMNSKLSGHSVMSYAQTAALFGCALKIANPENVDLWGFADGQFKADASRGHSLLRCAEDFVRQIGCVGGGTAMETAVRVTYDKHDRVIIISDMAAFPDPLRMWGRWYTPGGIVGDVAAAVPAKIPVYAYNLSAGSTTPIGKGNRHSLGGLTDSTFKQIPQLERLGVGSWPWMSS
jgi:hypothetical protein